MLAAGRSIAAILNEQRPMRRAMEHRQTRRVNPHSSLAAGFAADGGRLAGDVTVEGNTAPVVAKPGTFGRGLNQHHPRLSASATPGDGR